MKSFFKKFMSKPCTCKKCNNEYTQEDIEKYTQDFVYPLKGKNRESPFCIACLEGLATQCSNCGENISFGDAICFIEADELKKKISGANTYSYTLNKNKPNEKKIHCSVLCLRDECNVMIDPITKEISQDYKFPKNIIWFYDEENEIGMPKTLNRSALKNP